ncbi:MAG: cobalamin B12-binding domain-containing protein [Elusimicrobia bacterium]|nr:cobalamin B12-binding domain-containing protein [Elusimicrobiota bacterium]
MKALLIYPPQRDMVKTSIPGFINEKLGYYPPLGVLYVAAYAEKNSSHTVEVLDTQVEELDYEAIKAEVARRKPDVVGLYTVSFALVDALRVAKAVKEAAPGVPVVAGGPHPTIYPDETLAQPNIDFVISGEGEVPFLKLLEALSGKGPLKDVPNLTYRDNGAVVRTPQQLPIQDLNAIPYPDRKKIPHSKYYSVIAKTAPVTTIVSSRGCPFGCFFCATSGRKWRPRSVENIMGELEECVALGIREFFFFDDTFSIDKKRVHDLCDAILARKLDILFDIRTRVDTVDEAMLAKLRKAGCERVQYGVEAGTAEILKVLKKGIDIDRIKHVFKLTKSLGLTSFADFMIGSPGETREHIRQTVALALELNPDFVQFSITTPFPATEMYQEALNRKIFTADYWKEYALSPKEGFVPQLWNEHLSRTELEELTKAAYKSFYLRPAYVLKKLLRLRSPGELMHHISAGLHLLRA